MPAPAGATVPPAVVTRGATADDCGGGFGAHAAGLGVRRGGGSVGLPAPAGWNRHPSTRPAETREPPGPTFEYDHAPTWARKEFWSFTAFMNHCAEAYPPELAGERPLALMRRLYGLLTRARPAPP